MLLLLFFCFFRLLALFSGSLLFALLLSAFVWGFFVGAVVVVVAVVGRTCFGVAVVGVAVIGIGDVKVCVVFIVAAAAAVGVGVVFLPLALLLGKCRSGSARSQETTLETAKEMTTAVDPIIILPLCLLWAPPASCLTITTAVVLLLRITTHAPSSCLPPSLFDRSSVPSPGCPYYHIYRSTETKNDNDTGQSDEHKLVQCRVCEGGSGI